jgi:hypothetical protein
MSLSQQFSPVLEINRHVDVWTFWEAHSKQICPASPILLSIPEYTDVVSIGIRYMNQTRIVQALEVIKIASNL